MLEVAMATGALGLPSNLADQDRERRPVPTMLADGAEWVALFDILDRYPASVFQVAVRLGTRDVAGVQTEQYN